MGVGANVFERRFDSARCTVGGSHITPCKDGCSDVQAIREIDVVARVCSVCGGQWQCGRWWYGQGYVGWLVKAAVPTVGSTEHIGQLDLVG
jgi:hypothetical protein